MLGTVPDGALPPQSPRGDGPPARVRDAVRALIEEGTRLLDARSYLEAIGCFERALREDPASGPAREGLMRSHTALGVEFTNSGESLRARESFDRALRLGEDPVARLGLGYLDFMEARDGPAADNLERALSGNPKDSRALKLLALIEYRRGETASARKRMERAAVLDPKDEEAAAFGKRWAVEEKLADRLGESSSRHFLVRYDRIIHPDAMREILATLEAIHESIGQALGHWPSKRIPVLLLGEKEFFEATGSYHWVGGVYDGQIKLPVKAEDGRPKAERRTLLKTLRHEYTHVVVKELCPGCPNWLNEGIAQYFEIDSPQEKGAEKAKEDRARRREKMEKDLKALGNKRIQLESVRQRMWEISDQSVARVTYLEALGFVSFLVEKHSAFRLRLLLAAYRREGSLAKAFLSTYGASLKDLEEKWWKEVSP